MIRRPLASVHASAALLVLALVASHLSVGANPFARNSGEDHAVLNVAHAGAASLAPQNTIAAAQAAFEAGADVWGVDVRRTADGVFVLMHDATLDRTTDVEQIFPDRAPWHVAAFGLNEIEQLDAGSWFVEEDPFGEIAAGSVSDDAVAGYADARVPTLLEALEFVVAHDGLIDIEIKEPGVEDCGEIADALTSLIFAAGAEENVLVSSFDHGFLQHLRDIAPGIPIGALSLFAPPGGADGVEALGVDVYLPSLVGWTPDLAARLGEVGIGVIPWTYNDPAQLSLLASTPGISGIYTDYPQRLAPILWELREERSE